MKARQDQPQLLISDLLMPVIDGYTLLCMIVEKEPECVKVVVE